LTLEAALAQVAELHAQNTALQAENAVLREQMEALEQRIAAVEAVKRPPPPWANLNICCPATTRHPRHHHR
jgi:hypothetical protein